MTSSRRLTLSIICGLLTACHGAPHRAAPNPTAQGPTPLSFGVGSDGALMVSGRADPGARLLVDGASAGLADATGNWRLTWPQSSQPRELRLAAQEGALTLAPPGSLLLLPATAGAAILSPGGGARRLGEFGDGLHLLAIDYDSQGGMVVSGQGPPDADILVRIDNTTGGRGTVGDDGRFSIGLDRSVSMTGHTVEISGGAGVDSRSVRLSPATGGFNLQPQPFGWRLDWTTLAGGRQVTLLFDPPR